MSPRVLLLLALFAAPAVAFAQPPVKEAKKDDKKPTDDKKPADAKKEDKKADDKKPAKPKAVLRVKLAKDDAELSILGVQMKTTGTVREFDIPDVENGKPWEYELVAKWSPNNYTTITRTKLVSFKGGDGTVEVDLTQPDKETDKIFIRFVPTPDDIVKKMLELGTVGAEDTVYDLGCGDGRIVIAAVKDAKAKKGIGIDLDADRVKESKEAVAAAKLTDKVEIRQGDILKMTDLSDATVIMIYLGDEFGQVLGPFLKDKLKPGTRIVSHRFTLGDWKTDKTIQVTGEDGEEYTLHVWTVPAKK